MVVFGKPTQATKRKGTTKMHTANVSTAVRGRGNPSSVTTRAAAQPPEKGRGGVEGKKRGKNVERTAEGLEELKKALRRHVVEGIPMRKAAAEFDGVTKKDVGRYAKIIKALPEERRAAAIDALVWAQKGNPSVIARKAFVVDDEEIVASSVRVFCEMGMPFNDRSSGRSAPESSGRSARRTQRPARSTSAARAG